MNRKKTTALSAALCALCLLWGCSPARYRRQADREVHGIVEEKSEGVPGMHDDFSAEMQPVNPQDILPPAPRDTELDIGEPGNAPSGEHETPPLLLELDKALLLAAANSREYQNRRESVFLQALSLTGERNRFSPQFFWNLRGETGYDSGDKWTAGARSRSGMDWLLGTGGQLSAGLTTTASRILSGDTSGAAGSAFDLTFTQPLLRDSRIAAREPLTQAERDMVYELREFVRFQRRFMVGVLSEYYRVLERRQRAENERINYENLVRIRERAEALGDAGRLPELQVDRARQNELSARDSLDRAVQTYERALDSFKMTLGVSPEVQLVPDPTELEVLHELDMAAPPLGRQESIETALTNRLDLATRRQRLEDSKRKVRVAENALKPGLNLITRTSADTPGNQPLNFADGTQNSSLALEADLPLERTSERNTYRRRLIEYERANRELEEHRDSIVLEIKNRWRDFDIAVSSYGTQKRSLELANERVESTELLFDAGRATTRDVLDAHEDLLRAQNSLAQRLVDFRIAVLELERDMDTLVVDERGQLIEGAGYNERTGTE